MARGKAFVWTEIRATRLVDEVIRSNDSLLRPRIVAIAWKRKPKLVFLPRFAPGCGTALVFPPTSSQSSVLAD